MKTWKIQKFGSDLIYDLRSRGLLPLAAVLVIAIVAVPFVISKLSSSDSAPTSPPIKSAAVKPAPEGQPAVVSYSPGLRNYRDRLDKRNPSDPFVQQYTDSPGGTGAGDAASAGAGGDTVPTGGSTGGDGTVTITETTKSKLYYSYYETDVRVGEAGSTLKRYNSIDQFTLLPSEQTPILVFLGVATGGKQAIFSVSRQVTGVSGQGECYPDPASCELLGVKSGAGADVVYSVDNKSYRIEIARIKFVKSTEPPN